MVIYIIIMLEYAYLLASPNMIDDDSRRRYIVNEDIKRILIEAYKLVICVLR